MQKPRYIWALDLIYKLIDGRLVAEQLPGGQNQSVSLFPLPYVTKIILLQHKINTFYSTQEKHSIFHPLYIFNAWKYTSFNSQGTEARPSITLMQDPKMDSLSGPDWWTWSGIQDGRAKLCLRVRLQLPWR